MMPILAASHFASPPRTPVGPWPLSSTAAVDGATTSTLLTCPPSNGDAIPAVPSPPSTPVPSPRPTVPLTSLRKEGNKVRMIAEEMQTLSPTSRNALLALLVQDSSPQTLSPLLDMIIARLKRDFLKELPLELALHVLSFVDDAKTLARASAVSRFWRALLEDETTWRSMCWKNGFSDDRPGAVRSIQHLEFGQRIGEDNSTPAGRERRGTLDRTGLSEITARASLLSLSPLTNTATSTAENRTTEETQRSSERTEEAGNESTSPTQLRMSAWSRGLGVESPIASRQPLMNSILLEQSQQSSAFEDFAPALEQQNREDIKAFSSLPSSPRPTTKDKQPFSYKNHFKRAYLTESNWLHGPGRLLSTQVSAEDGVVTCLGFDNEHIVIGMATNKIHIFRSKDGKYLRTLDGHEIGVWCLVLVSKSAPAKEGRRKGGSLSANSGSTAAMAQAGPSKPRTNSAQPNLSTEAVPPTNAPFLAATTTPPTFMMQRRNSFPSFVDGAASESPGSASHTRPSTAEQQQQQHYPDVRIGGMGLGAGGETGESAQQANVCGTARGWGQDHSVVVSAGCDRQVRVWNVDTGDCLKIMRGHTSTVRCMRVLDGRPIAVSGSRDATLRVWDLEKGSCLRVLTGHEHSVRCIENCGNKVVSGSYDTTCRLWDVDTGQCLFVFRGHQHQIYAVAFDGSRIVTGSLDSTVRVWDAETGEQTALLQGHTSLVGQLQLDPIANVLVTGGSDGRVIVFSLDTNTPRFRLSAHDNSVTCLQFDDRFIVTGGNDGRVKLWDFRDGKFVRELAEPYDAVWRVAIRDDKCVILCRKEGKTVMDVRTFRPTERDLFGSS